MDPYEDPKDSCEYSIEHYDTPEDLYQRSNEPYERSMHPFEHHMYFLEYPVDLYEYPVDSYEIPVDPLLNPYGLLSSSYERPIDRYLLKFFGHLRISYGLSEGSKDPC